MALAVDRLIGLFAREFDPAIIELLFETQTRLETIIDQYALWFDLMGITPERLPTRRDGSSTEAIQQAVYRIVSIELGELLRLAAELQEMDFEPAFLHSGISAGVRFRPGA